MAADETQKQSIWLAWSKALGSILTAAIYTGGYAGDGGWAAWGKERNFEAVSEKNICHYLKK